VWLDFFFKFLFIIEGARGVEVSFLLFHLTCGRGKGGELVFFFS